MLISIETTPNPNSMKLNLSESLHVTGTFIAETKSAAPAFVARLLELQGIQSIFVSDDFLTLNRDPRADWKILLNAAKQLFSEGGDDLTRLDSASTQTAGGQVGQIQVLVQTFRGIPIQVKVTDGNTEERVGLPAYFGKAARELQTHFGADYLKERYWADWGVRYGSLAEVAQEVFEEIEGLMDEATLETQKKLALGNSASSGILPPVDTVADQRQYLDISDWQQRFRLVKALEATDGNLPIFVRALHDAQPQIRRWTAARLAAVKTKESVAALCDSLLNDPNVGVRRTAGDSLSDIADISAEGAVCQALKDSNKLVRWRAARFLTEIGTEAALPFLEAALDEAEYEVHLEVEAAMSRIREGSIAPLPVWKQMSQSS